MKVVQLIPGAGNTFYCENCLRDVGLLKALRELGHDAMSVPLYLPIMTDETNTSTRMPVFFGGINVYLQQKAALFRKTPRWVDKFFDAPALLRGAAKMAGMTRATDLAETTLSMLHGKDGHQAKELDRLLHWLEELKPEVVHISNVLLAGMARRIRQELQIPVTCTLQDEDIFVDVLPEPYRQEIWDTLAERAHDIDAFVSVSQYFKDFMQDRLRVEPDRIHVVYTGIDLANYTAATTPPDSPVIGFLERQCHEKGLHILVDAFILLKQRDRIPGLRLRVTGGHTADDHRYMRAQHKKLKSTGLQKSAEFLPNLSRSDKIRFLQDLSVLSVPAVHHEGFGLYVVEAMACSVPVVQPAEGAFPELIDLTGGGLLYEPNEPEALADALESLLLNQSKRTELGKQGSQAVHANFSVERMAAEVSDMFGKVAKGFTESE